jgi:hypothetical protein
VLGTSPEENADHFKQYYEKLFTNEPSATKPDQSARWYNEMPQRTTDRDWGPPTLHEMLKAIKDLKPSAPGLSGVPASVWQGLAHDPVLCSSMLRVMRKCWIEEIVPDQWTQFYMTVLEKPGDHSLPKNYRGISIAESLSKVYTTILKYRLSDLYEDIAPEFANGFRKGRGRTDSVCAVLETLRKRKSWGQSSYLLLFDCIKCFDRIKREHIWSSMAKMGVSAKMIRVVRSTLEGSTAVIHVEGVQRDVRVMEGTGQGTTLGPVLCNYFLLPLLLHWEEKWASEATVMNHKNGHGDDISTGTMLHSFADDIAIIVSTRQEAERVARRLYHFLQDFLMDLHVATPVIEQSKSVVLFFPSYDSEIELRRERPLTIDSRLGKTISFVSSARYLGHIISKTLTDDLHIQGRMAKTNQVFGALRPQLFGRKSVWLSVKAKVMESMILPTLLDGVECCVVSKRMMADMETCYLKMVRKCLKITPYIQRKFRLTSKKLLKRLGVRPLHYYVDLKVLAYAGHVQRMAPHRLTRIIRHSKLSGSRRCGRPKKMLQENIKESLIRKKIQVQGWEVLALNRVEWAKAIRDDSYHSARIKTRSRKKRRPFWTRAPHSIIGCYVERKFGHKWYLGQIWSVDVDEATDDILWKVLYDDGDSEDFNRRELQKVLCLDMHVIM